ncbi:MAG: AraC-like DNA-binding protein [bacterium]|jgi:AraC-like DNA-binding protein
MNAKVFKCNKLPFLELRYVLDKLSCEKKHTHEALTVTAIKEGQVDLLFNDKIEYLKPNFVAVINPHQAHSAEVINSDSKGGYALYLDLQWYCENIQNLLLTNHNNFLPFQTSVFSSKLIYNEFIELCDLLFESVFLLEKEEKLIEFLIKLFQTYHPCKLDEDIDIKNNEVAKQIKSILDENLDIDLTLNEISLKSGLSTRHCLRIFKKEYGLPIHAYILNQKIHKAKELLSTDMPIIDVALESGFFDQSHLTKSFKLVFQVTPKQYQNAILH